MPGEAEVQNEFYDEALANATAVTERVVAIQDETRQNDERAHGALTASLAKSYRTWRTILASSTADVVAGLLIRHGLPTKEPRQGASRYSFAIQLFAGRFDADVTANGLDGKPATKWEPSANWKRYTSVWDFLDASPEDEDFEVAIREAGGPNAIVKAAQDRKRAAEKEGRASEEVEEKALLLEEGEASPIDVGAVDLAGTGEFFSLLCQKVNGGEDIVILGVSDADATQALKRMAKKQAGTLAARREGRIAGEQKAMIDVVGQEGTAILRGNPARLREIVDRLKSEMTASAQNA